MLTTTHKGGVYYKCEKWMVKWKQVQKEKKIWERKEKNIKRERDKKGDKKRVKEIETKQKDRISKFSLKNGTL